MQDLTKALEFLIRNLADCFVSLLLIRFYLQAMRIPFRHPLAHFVLTLTNWLVLPLRHVLRAVGRFDTTSILLAWLIAFLMQILISFIYPWHVVLTSPVSLAAFASAAMLELFKISLFLLLSAILCQSVMSWLMPYNPLMPTLSQFTQPWLRPLRRFIPPIDGIDITPWIMSLLILTILGFLVPFAEKIIVAQIIIAA